MVESTGLKGTGGVWVGFVTIVEPKFTLLDSIAVRAANASPMLKAIIRVLTSNIVESLRFGCIFWFSVI